MENNKQHGVEVLSTFLVTSRNPYSEVLHSRAIAASGFALALQVISELCTGFSVSVCSVNGFSLFMAPSK